MFVASAFAHNRLWNALHRQMHIPEDVFFKDWKVYRFLARYHFMHHQMNGRNFNVVCPLADFVLCRTAKPRVRDIRNMLTLGLLYQGQSECEVVWLDGRPADLPHTWP